MTSKIKTAMAQQSASNKKRAEKKTVTDVPKGSDIKEPLTTPRVIDWFTIEGEYRAGLKSVRLIAREQGVSHVALIKKAELLGWSRDLTAKIAAEAAARLQVDAAKEAAKAVTSAANSAVTTDTKNQLPKSKVVTPVHKVSESEIVDANAERQFQVLKCQRTDISAHRDLANKLLAELMATTTDIGLFEQLGELLDESGANEKGIWVEDKLNKIYRAVISLGGRVDASKKLGDTLATLIKLEREAYGIKADGDGATGRTPVDDALAAMFKQAGK